MNNAIKCPHCGKPVEITEALKHQIEEKVLADINLKHKQQIASQALKLLGDILLKPMPHRQKGNDRPHADDDAQHSEDGAHLVCGQGA